MDLSTFYNQFRDETAENVRILSDGLLALERMNDTSDPAYREQLDAIFRAVHTIKGSARMLGFEAIGRLSHTMEHLLGGVRAGQQTLDSILASQLLRSGDALLELTLAAVEGSPSKIDVDSLVKSLSPEATTPPVAPVVPRPHESPAVQANGATTEAPPRTNRRAGGARTTVRVRVDRLDRLMNLAGELALEYQAQVAQMQAIQELQDHIGQQERILARWSSEIEREESYSSGRDLSDQRLSEVLAITRHLRKMMRTQTESMAVRANQHRILLDDLEREVVSVRLLPVSTVFGALPRAVRDLAADLGKEVSLQIMGETTELDRKLLEAIADPLVHLVRNALDHGIERSNERVAAGKSPTGTVTISASAMGNEVRITVQDDGRGVDPDAVRASAVRKGLISQQAAELLGDGEVLELLFMPGFSTAPMITDVSGRGVGLDVVRTNVGDLGGQTMVESQPGVGTTITLVLPLTLVTTRVLLIELAGTTYGLPVSGCRSIVWTNPATVESIEGQACIQYGERTVPLLRLADLLGVAGQRTVNDQERIPTLIVGTNQRLVALIIDRLDNELETVVKPLGPLFEQRRRYAGALQLGDGRLVLLLNPLVLAQEARGMAVTTRHSHQPTPRSRLLVADDSFATRELIRTILEAAGYDVTVAIDGADALGKVRDAPYDLVVSDVEMPHLNGFELTERIRRELGLRDLPVIIVTSLQSDDHKRRGMESGAQAYLVKSQFHQDALLDTIRQLLGH